MNLYSPVVPPGTDPLAALEQRIDLVLTSFESGNAGSWADVEELLTEGYGRLLAVEAVCVRLEGQLDDDGSASRGSEADAERRDLEEFHRILVADAAGLRDTLARFKTRGLAARRQRRLWRAA
jgi:hypothetical protein